LEKRGGRQKRLNDLERRNNDPPSWKRANQQVLKNEMADDFNNIPKKAI